MLAVASRASLVLRPVYSTQAFCLRGRLTGAGTPKPRSWCEARVTRLYATAAMRHDFVPLRQRDNSDAESEGIKLRIISYNILAQCYIKSEIFPYAPKNTLKWKNRSKVLEEELLSFDADFICLQELDMFAEFFQPLMEQHGYSCLYKQRPNKKNDGCGIFYRKDKFTLLERRDVDFNDLVPEEDLPEEPPAKMPRTSDDNGAEAPSTEQATTSSTLTVSETASSVQRLTSVTQVVTEQVPSTSDAKAVPNLTGLAERLIQGPGASFRPVKDFATAARFSKEPRLQRDCVAVFGAFRPVNTAKGAFVVGNTHIYWDPQWIDVKLAQAEYLLYSLHNFLGSFTEGAREDVPVMLCGDFNSQPGDRVYRYLTSAKSPEDQPTVEGKARKVDIDSAANKLFLSSAPLEIFSAHEKSGGEPPFTNYTPKFTGTLDYCFITRPLVPCLAGRKSLPTKTEESLGVGVPNQLYPSDHLPIGFDFELRTKDFT